MQYAPSPPPLCSRRRLFRGEGLQVDVLPLATGSSEASPADWDSLNLNCDQAMNASDDDDGDNLGLSLSDPLELTPGPGADTGAAASSAADAAGGRSRKLMRMVARALDED